jgi:Ca-activated chloride channel homolog
MIRYPQSLFLLVLFIPLFWSIISSLIRGKSAFRHYRGGRSMRSFPDLFLVKWFFASLFLVLFLFFIVISLLGLSGSTIESEQLPEKSDIVFLVDISRSMLAADVEPTRLERAKMLIRTLVNESSGSRYGLVIFTDIGVVLVPVSEDLLALLSSVDILDPDILSSSGTDIEAGLTSAAGAFPQGERRRKTIVLFSDGEHHMGDPRGTALSIYRQEQITLHAVALGSREGAEVPDGSGNVISDGSGRAVVSSLNPVVLRAVAEAGGGSFIDGGRSDALKQLREVIGVDDFDGVKLTRSTLYRPFLALALLFLFLHAAVRMVPWLEK